MNRKNPSAMSWELKIEICLFTLKQQSYLFIFLSVLSSFSLQTMHKEKVKSTQNANKANNKEHKLNGSTKENSDKTGQ